MMPLNLEDLQFTTDGELVTISRPANLPIIESEEVEIEEEFVFEMNGKEVRSKGKSKTKISPLKLSFKKYDGRWQMAFNY